jgi:serine/threonine protein kinase
VDDDPQLLKICARILGEAGANILVKPDGAVKLTGFGIARIASQTMTQTGFTMGRRGIRENGCCEKTC